MQLAVAIGHVGSAGVVPVQDIRDPHAADCWDEGRALHMHTPRTAAGLAGTSWRYGACWLCKAVSVGLH